MKGFLPVSLAFAVFFVLKQSHAATVGCDFAALAQAATQSGTYGFICDTTIIFTNQIAIDKVVEFDGAGHKVVFDGQTVSRFFEIAPGGSLTLRNVTLQSGRHEGIASHVDDSPRGVSEATNGEGGAVHNGGTFRAFDCTFQGNVAQGGTAAYNGLYLSSSVGIGTGGAIYSEGELTVERCVFDSNLSTGGDAPVNGPFPGTPGADGLGGAVYIAGGNVTIRNSRMTGNTARASRSNLGGVNGLGGGLFVAGGIVEVIGSAFSSNSALGGYGHYNAGYGSGGGVYARAGRLDLLESSVNENTVKGEYNPIYSSGGPISAKDARGGGMFIEANAVVTVIRSTFRGNTAGIAPTTPPINPSPFPSYYPVASGFGGAIWNEGNLQLLNTTLAENVARCAGSTQTNYPPEVEHGNAHGGAIYAAGSNSITRLSFCTLARNRADRPVDTSTNNAAHGGGIYRAAGQVTVDNSLLAENAVENSFGAVTDGGHNLVTDSSLNPRHATSLQTADAKIGLTGLYGGPTETVPLLPGSPAIDSAECITTNDQRNVSRPKGAGCDMGAFEAGSDQHYLVVALSTNPWTALTLTQGDRMIFLGTETYAVLGAVTPGRYEIGVTGQGVLAAPVSVEVTAQSPEIIQVIAPIERSFTADLAVTDELIHDNGLPLTNAVVFGQPILHQITVTNAGPGMARDIRLIGDFFGQQTNVDPGGMTTLGNVISTNLPNLLPNLEPFSSTTFYVTTKADVNATNALTRLTVSSSDDPNATNNIATTSLAIRASVVPHVVQLITAPPDQAGATALAFDAGTGKTFFGRYQHNLTAYNPATQQFEDVPLALGPFGVTSLATAKGGGILYVGAGDRVLHLNTATLESTAFNLETNFASFLVVSPVDPELVAVANIEQSLQLYKNGQKLPGTFNLGGPIAFSDDGGELYLKALLLSQIPAQECDLTILIVDANGLSPSRTLPILCGSARAISINNGYLYFTPEFGYGVFYPQVLNLADLHSTRLNYSAVPVPHPDGTVSVLEGNLAIQRRRPETLTPFAQLDLRLPTASAYSGPRLLNGVATGTNSVAFVTTQSINIVEDLRLDPAAPLQVWQSSPDAVTLRFGTLAGAHYVVESASEAITSVWSPVQEVVGKGDDVELQIKADSTRRFFRMATSSE